VATFRNSAWKTQCLKTTYGMQADIEGLHVIKVHIVYSPEMVGLIVKFLIMTAEGVYYIMGFSVCIQTILAMKILIAQISNSPLGQI